jgi:DNA-binding response OmpR family regulator
MRAGIASLSMHAERDAVIPLAVVRPLHPGPFVATEDASRLQRLTHSLQVQNVFSMTLQKPSKALALVDGDKAYSKRLSDHLRRAGLVVDAFSDSNHLLACSRPYAYGLYVTELDLPGVDGIDLIKVLRLRTNAGIAVVSGRLGLDTFKQVFMAGADVYLPKPAPFDQIETAIKALSSRVCSAPRALEAAWLLDRGSGLLLSPDRSRIELNGVARTLIDSFLDADGQPVARATLLECIGRVQGAGASACLNTSISRLRRRIQSATGAAAPLRSVFGVGYIFRASLKAL